MKQFKYKVGDVVKLSKAVFEHFESYDFAREIVKIVDMDVFRIDEVTKELTYFDYEVESEDGNFGLYAYEEDIEGFA